MICMPGDRGEQGEEKGVFLGLKFRAAELIFLNQILKSRDNLLTRGAGVYTGGKFQLIQNIRRGNPPGCGNLCLSGDYIRGICPSGEFQKSLRGGSVACRGTVTGDPRDGAECARIYFFYFCRCKCPGHEQPENCGSICRTSRSVQPVYCRKRLSRIVARHRYLQSGRRILFIRNIAGLCVVAKAFARLAHGARLSAGRLNTASLFCIGAILLL